jgi:hypothetical protein
MWCDGREHGQHKADKARRCSRLVWPLGARRRDMRQLQRFSHHAHRVLVQPMLGRLLMQDPRR